MHDDKGLCMCKYVLVKFSFESQETSYVSSRGFADLLLLQLKLRNNRTETVVFLESEQSAAADVSICV